MFSLFKKNGDVRAKLNNPKTILCIPGKWASRSEIVTSIATHNLNEFIFAGAILLNLKTKAGFEVEICERDERMKDSFQWAGLVNRLSAEFLSEVDQHKFVVYVIGETGTPDKARAIAEAGNAMLKAGGIGIKVETTGKAFTKEHWTELVTHFELANLYEMFVLDSIRNEKGTVFSCGMHNIGLRDSIVDGEEFQNAVDLISVFAYYQLLEKPAIYPDQTFSAAPESPVFIIQEETRQPYQGDDLFENPFGMWRLERKSIR